VDLALITVPNQLGIRDGQVALDQPANTLAAADIVSSLLGNTPGLLPLRQNGAVVKPDFPRHRLGLGCCLQTSARDLPPTPGGIRQFSVCIRNAQLFSTERVDDRTG